jgi:hypothetical protein
LNCRVGQQAGDLRALCQLVGQSNDKFRHRRSPSFEPVHWTRVCCCLVEESIEQSLHDIIVIVRQALEFLQYLRGIACGKCYARIAVKFARSKGFLIAGYSLNAVPLRSHRTLALGPGHRRQAAALRALYDRALRALQ